MSFKHKLLPGTVLADRYEIVESAGEGGMGALYRARHLHVERQVAVKVLLSTVDNDAAHKRFIQEAKIAGSLSHTNLVSVYDFGKTAEGIPFLVMDFLEGVTLSAVMLKNHALQPEQVLDIMIQLCEGLRHAHSKGLIHRDLKPSNVMLLDEDGRTVVKIMDFGIAKKVDDTQHLTKTGEVFGSPLYMSPEQCQGQVLDARSDIYSIGCMIFEMVSGQVPLRGENTLQTICKHLTETPQALSAICKVPHELEVIVERCLQKDPNQRFQTVSELLKALRSAVQASGSLKESDSAPRTVKMTAGSVSPGVLKVESTSAQPLERKSTRVLAISAIAVASLTGIGFAVGIPLMTKQSRQRGAPPIMVARSQSNLSTVTNPTRPPDHSNIGTPESVTPTNSTSGPDTGFSSADSPGGKPLETTHSAHSTTVEPEVEEATKKQPAGGDTPETDKPPADKPQINKPPEKIPVHIDSTGPQQFPVPAPIDVNKVATSPASPVGRTTAVQAASPPQPAATPPQAEEERLRTETKKCLAEAEKQIDSLIGDAVWTVDWSSLDAAALEHVSNQGIDKIREAIEEICHDSIGRDSLRGKLRKIVVRNVKEKILKRLTFKDGTLEVQASWSCGDWDYYPHTRELVQVIENGL